jgi:hypothetical protein
MLQAVIYAALEILERDAKAQAHRMPHFFDRYQIDVASVQGRMSSAVLEKLRAANMLTGVWRIPTAHDLPVYWCHIMEDDWRAELVPLPAEGAACGCTEDHALSRALLEACQARLTAISGAREDVTRQVYPSAYDRPHLDRWRQQLRTPSHTKKCPEGNGKDEQEPALQLEALSPALAGFEVISHWVPFLLFSVYFGSLADGSIYRANLVTGANRVHQDRGSLFSVSYSGPAITLEPSSNGDQGWDDFLIDFNQTLDEAERRLGAVPCGNGSRSPSRRRRSGETFSVTWRTSSTDCPSGAGECSASVSAWDMTCRRSLDLRPVHLPAPPASTLGIKGQGMAFPSGMHRKGSRDSTRTSKNEYCPIYL